MCTRRDLAYVHGGVRVFCFVVIFEMLGWFVVECEAYRVFACATVDRPCICLQIEYAHGDLLLVVVFEGCGECLILCKGRV